MRISETLQLAVEYPFRQAMSLLRHEIGDEISHQTIDRWAQEEGKKLRAALPFQGKKLHP